MGKKQTRRTISVSGELYARIREAADGGAFSAYVESVMREHFGMPSRKVSAQVEALGKALSSADEIFTF